MCEELEIFDTVALLRDLPEGGLRRGQVGTVVEVWERGLYDVEFCGLGGYGLGIKRLERAELMQLRYGLIQDA